MATKATKSISSMLKHFKRVSTGKTALYQEVTEIPREWNEITVKVSEANNSYFAILVDGNWEFVRTSNALYESLQNGEYSEGEVLSAELHLRSAIPNVPKHKLEEYGKETISTYKTYLEQKGNFFYATSVEEIEEDDE